MRFMYFKGIIARDREHNMSKLTLTGVVYE